MMQVIILIQIDNYYIRINEVVFVKSAAAEYWNKHLFIVLESRKPKIKKRAELVSGEGGSFLVCRQLSSHYILAQQRETDLMFLLLKCQ